MAAILGKFNIELTYTKAESIFTKRDSESWRQMKIKAVNRGAYRLKEKVKEKFVQKMPNADKPLTSKYNGKRWKGKLIDVVRQGKPGVMRTETYTNAHILGSRKSGHGDFIGLFYNKGTFKSPGRYGKGKNKQFRGDLEAQYYFQEGTRGFKFTDTVNAILKAQIDKINSKK